MKTPIAYNGWLYAKTGAAELRLYPPLHTPMRDLLLATCLRPVFAYGVFCASGSLAEQGSTVDLQRWFGKQIPL